MKKKTISALATLAAATVILVGSLLSSRGDDILRNGTADAGNILNRPAQESSLKGTKTEGTLKGGANSKGAVTKQTKPGTAAKGDNQNSSGSVKGQDSVKGTTFPDNIIEAKEEGIVPFGYIEATVTKVTDGDTFHITYNGRDYKVRMLDIDTPESVKSGVKPQPFSKEASELTKETLTGKKVKLIFEKGTTDQFDRLLAHVVLEDETYYNAYMVENGYAICVFYSPNTLLRDYFNQLQAKAIDAQTGFWRLSEADRPFIKDSKGKYIATYKSKKSKAA
ncbi:MAG: micrococcal nuclease-like nuclease [Eubacterium sp.]|nr:micrococcal nuclease-like nuclease [Eubacterium sp.]